jgi:hypothetical protein
MLTKTKKATADLPPWMRTGNARLPAKEAGRPTKKGLPMSGVVRKRVQLAKKVEPPPIAALIITALHRIGNNRLRQGVGVASHTITNPTIE